MFPFQACLVHTSETIRLCYFMERLLQRRRPLMLVGTAGTGKSVLVGAKLASLDAEEYLVKNVPFNYYTTSAMLQGKAPRGVEGGCLSGHVTWPGTGASGRCLLTHWAGQFSSSHNTLLSLPSLPSHSTSVPLLHPLAWFPPPILSPCTPIPPAGFLQGGISTQSRSSHPGDKKS